MKKVVVFLMVFGLMIGVSGLAQATITTIDIAPSMVPDENQPRVAGEAPAGWGTDSWQGPLTGKTNWHARYNADGSYLNALFSNAATLTIGDLAEISYFTKGEVGAIDWNLIIYTRPTGSGWYSDRFYGNSGVGTGDWKENSTNSGLTFRDGAGTFTNWTLAELGASSHAGDLIEMISIQTWTNQIVNGYIDGLTITLDAPIGTTHQVTGDVGRVNFVGAVPEPATMLLLGLGLIGLAGARRKFKK
jgi:hypothetical protein